MIFLSRETGRDPTLKITASFCDGGTTARKILKVQFVAGDLIHTDHNALRLLRQGG